MLLASMPRLKWPLMSIAMDINSFTCSDVSKKKPAGRLVAFAARSLFDRNEYPIAMSPPVCAAAGWAARGMDAVSRHRRAKDLRIVTNLLQRDKSWKSPSHWIRRIQ